MHREIMTRDHGQVNGALRVWLGQIKSYGTSKQTNICGERLEQKVMKLYLLPYWAYGMKLFVLYSQCTVGHAGVARGYVNNKKLLTDNPVSHDIYSIPCIPLLTGLFDWCISETATLVGVKNWWH